MIFNKHNILTYLDILKESRNKCEIIKYIFKRIVGIRAKFDKDVILKSNGLLFNCGRIMENCTVACSAFESDLFDGIELKPGIFIDVGAHIGKHSLNVAKKYGESINVVSIEAAPETFRLLKNNIELNAPLRVQAFNFACSDKVGKTTFWRNEYHPATNSLFKLNHTQKLTLSTNTLDNTIKEKSAVSAIKIDVEGAELKVLNGAKKILAQSKPIILFEAWDGRKLAMISGALANYGYKITQVNEENYIAVVPKTV